MFEWDHANIRHIARHRVAPEEAEEAMADPDRVRARARGTATEPRAAVIGATATGQVLFVAYTIRAGRYRVVTARPASRSERRDYQRGPS